MAIAVWIDEEPGLPGDVTFDYQIDPVPETMAARIEISGDEKREFDKRVEQAFKLGGEEPGDLSARIFEVLYLFLLTRRGRRDPKFRMTKLTGISFEDDAYQFVFEASPYVRSRDTNVEAEDMPDDTPTEELS